MGRGLRGLVVGTFSGTLFLVFCNCNPKIRGFRSFSFDIVFKIRFWSWSSGILDLGNRDTWEERIFYMIPDSRERITASAIVGTQCCYSRARIFMILIRLRISMCGCESHALRLGSLNQPMSPPGMSYSLCVPLKTNNLIGSSPRSHYCVPYLQLQCNTSNYKSAKLVERLCLVAAKQAVTPEHSSWV